jgi:uncharacterized protein (DUF1330 family)
MPAYVIVEIQVNDPHAYEDYKKLTPATIAAFGGRFIVRGGTVQTVEGDWSPERIVVLEFDSMETANRWWNSDLYNTAKKIRQSSATTRMIFVEGVPGSGV